MSPAPNEWDLARRLDTLSLNIGRHPGGFLVVFLVTSYSSVSPPLPPPCIILSILMLGSTFRAVICLWLRSLPKPGRVATPRALSPWGGGVCLQRLFSAGRRNPPLPPKQGGSSQAVGHVWTHKDTSVFNTSLRRPGPARATTSPRSVRVHALGKGLGSAAVLEWLEPHVLAGAASY